MKHLFLTITLTLFTAVIFAQKDTVRLKRNGEEYKPIVTDRPPQAVYFQFGGPALLFSGNYDRRFGKRVNGAGFAAGFGFFSAFRESVVTLPVSLNYLFGRRSDFLEVAGGATYATSSSEDFSNDSGGGIFIYHVSAGYRHQPATGGFFFRGGICPLFSQGEQITWYYLGFGYNF